MNSKLTLGDWIYIGLFVFIASWIFYAYRERAKLLSSQTTTGNNA